MTGKNVSIAIGFGVITASQLALGMCLVTLAAGKSKYNPYSQKSCTSLRVRRPTTPTDTPRCISFVCIRPTQNAGGRIYKPIPLLRYANIIQGSNRVVFISTDSAGDVCTRLSRVLVDDVPGVEVGSGKTQSTDNYGNHRGGFVVVFPGYIHLPFRAGDYPTSWTGECDPPLLDYHQRCLMRACVGIHTTTSS